MSAHSLFFGVALMFVTFPWDIAKTVFVHLLLLWTGPFGVFLILTMPILNSCLKSTQFLGGHPL